MATAPSRPYLTGAISKVLGVEVGQPMRHSGPDGCCQTRRNSVCTISQRHPHRETLGEILSGGIVFGVGGNEIHVVLLRLGPARRGSMTGIKRGVRAFVNEGFFKNAFGLPQIRLPCMNKHIVVPATERLHFPCESRPSGNRVVEGLAVAGRSTSRMFRLHAGLRLTSETRGSPESPD